MLKIRDGLEIRPGCVYPDNPVQFHCHKYGHWLICCDNLIIVETERKGHIRMLPGDVLWVEAEDMHKLTAPGGPAHYACVGKEGL